MAMSAWLLVARLLAVRLGLVLEQCCWAAYIVYIAVGYAYRLYGGTL